MIAGAGGRNTSAGHGQGQGRVQCVSEARPMLADSRPFDGVCPLMSTYLLSSIAHEIRTPVTALATASEIILEDLDQMSREDLRRITETMHRGAVWLQGLVENLLCAATLTEGRLRIYRQRLSLGELAREVMGVVEPLLRQRGQWVRVTVRRGTGVVLADGRRIGQVLINLLANASKHGRPGTRIDVQVSQRGDRVRVRVADRGPGLPSGDPESLFTAFTRGAEATRSAVDGVGLGLAIVRSIVELHGGRVGCGQRRGGGAAFWFDIPLATPEEDDFVVRERLA
jgi:two-component system, OmpR family, sensor histidine kinase KdpD